MLRKGCCWALCCFAEYLEFRVTFSNAGKSGPRDQELLTGKTNGIPPRTGFVPSARHLPSVTRYHHLQGAKVLTELGLLAQEQLLLPTNDPGDDGRAIKQNLYGFPRRQGKLVKWV